MPRCRDCFRGLCLACVLKIALSNDRACWSVTILISCWLVWRDVLSGWLRSVIENIAEERRRSKEEKANVGSGRIQTNEIESEESEELPEGSQLVDAYHSGPSNNVTYPSINATGLTQDEINVATRPSARTGPPAEVEIPSGGLRVPDITLSGRIQELA